MQPTDKIVMDQIKLEAAKMIEMIEFELGREMTAVEKAIAKTAFGCGMQANQQIARRFDL